MAQRPRCISTQARYTRAWANLASRRATSYYKQSLLGSLTPQLARDEQPRSRASLAYATVGPAKDPTRGSPIGAGHPPSAIKRLPGGWLSAYHRCPELLDKPLSLRSVANVRRALSKLPQGSMASGQLPNCKPHPHVAGTGAWNKIGSAGWANSICTLRP